MTVVIQRFQFRRGTAAEWAEANPVLADGEPGVERDTGKQKIGNGVSTWTALPYTATKGEQGIPGVADDASVAQQVTNGPETVAALSATIFEQVAPTKAKVDAISSQALPLREMTVAARGTDPIPCGSFDGYLWGTSAVVSNATLYRSSDGGVTWTQYGTNTLPINGMAVAQGVQKMLKAGDGEVLAVSLGNVLRSTGWASGNPTWSEVLSNPTASYFYPWGFDGEDEHFILVHYSGSGGATPNRADSRYGWISTNGGKTWTIKWDTAARFGAEVNALTHLHGCGWDKWEHRFFISEGHDPAASGVYTSYDNGDTWTKVPYGDSFKDSKPGNAPTVVVPTDKGVVFGSDDAHNGIYTMPRGSNTIEHTWAWGGMQNSQLLGYALQGSRDPETGMVYISYISDETDLPAPVGASDGITASEVWREPGVFGMWRKLFIQGNRILMWEQLGNQIARGKLGGIGARGINDPGRVTGGQVTGGRKSVAAGAEAVAIGDNSVAVGGGAATTTHNGTAVGADAKVTGSGTSVGSGALSEALGVAVGYLASAMGGLAIGASAFVASVTSTAIGRGARAATDAGAANVNSTAVGRDAKANAASGNATAIGQGATASGASSVALGKGSTASLASATALGETATASGSSSVALGRAATSSHTNSVALGANTTTTGNDQVQMGARYIELAELAADPAAPAANGGRLYVRDNGSGKSQVVVRLNTGAIGVLYTEP